MEGRPGILVTVMGQSAGSLQTPLPRVSGPFLWPSRGAWTFTTRYWPLVLRSWLPSPPEGSRRVYQPTRAQRRCCVCAKLVCSWSPAHCARCLVPTEPQRMAHAGTWWASQWVAGWRNGRTRVWQKSRGLARKPPCLAAGQMALTISLPIVGSDCSFLWDSHSQLFKTRYQEQPQPRLEGLSSF